MVAILITAFVIGYGVFASYTDLKTNEVYVTPIIIFNYILAVTTAIKAWENNTFLPNFLYYLVLILVAMGLGWFKIWGLADSRMLVTGILLIEYLLAPVDLSKAICDLYYFVFVSIFACLSNIVWRYIHKKKITGWHDEFAMAPGFLIANIITIGLGGSIC